MKTNIYPLHSLNNFSNFVNNKTQESDIIDYLFKKLQFRIHLIEQSKQITSNIFSLEDFVFNKKDIIKNYDDIRDDIVQAIEGFQTIMKVNNDLYEEVTSQNARIKNLNVQLGNLTNKNKYFQDLLNDNDYKTKEIVRKNLNNELLIKEYEEIINSLKEENIKLNEELETAYQTKSEPKPQIQQYRQINKNFTDEFDDKTKFILEVMDSDNDILASIVELYGNNFLSKLTNKVFTEDQISDIEETIKRLLIMKKTILVPETERVNTEKSKKSTRSRPKKTEENNISVNKSTAHFENENRPLLTELKKEDFSQNYRLTHNSKSKPKIDNDSVPIFKGGVQFEKCLRGYSSKKKNSAEKKKLFNHYISKYGKNFSSHVTNNIACSENTALNNVRKYVTKNNIYNEKENVSTISQKVDNNKNIKIEDETEFENN